MRCRLVFPLMRAWGVLFTFLHNQSATLDQKLVCRGRDYFSSFQWLIAPVISNVLHTGEGLNLTKCSVILTSAAVSQLQPLFPVALSTLDVIHWGGMFQTHTAAIWSAGRMVEVDLIIFIPASSSLLSPTECRFVSFLIHVSTQQLLSEKMDKYVFCFFLLK